MTRARAPLWLSLLAAGSVLACARDRPARDELRCELDPATVRASGTPRNVILFVGDGMGEEHVRAARMFANGERAPLGFETLAVRGELVTRNAHGAVTDSAAGATAMATGRKVSNKVVSVARPGDGRDLVTALERHAAAGKRTGLVTTGTPLTDATPAAFAAHVERRGRGDEVARDYLERSRPNALFGPGGEGLSAERAREAGYTVVTSASALDALHLDEHEHVAALFPLEDTPPLPTLTRAALELLEGDADGFFLLVEHEGIDAAAHRMALPRVLPAVLELDEAVAVARAWAKGRDDTLLIVTADHETGGLRVFERTPRAGAVPGHSFRSAAHTDADVPLFAEGPGSALLSGRNDNTCVFHVVTGVPPRPRRVEAPR